ncbi:hypothetical protein BHE74_00059821 [Ensete ventricosum]|nr:hypothetical protein BHE74_00059821 [Ensete ventricosum]
MATLPRRELLPFLPQEPRHCGRVDLRHQKVDIYIPKSSSMASHCFPPSTSPTTAPSTSRSSSSISTEGISASVATLRPSAGTKPMPQAFALVLVVFSIAFSIFFELALATPDPPLYLLEIVYPCIPDSDGEDEGGQASSSIAVCTRWISAAKLLQSDLATLAQREGGE